MKEERSIARGLTKLLALSTSILFLFSLTEYIAQLLTRPQNAYFLLATRHINAVARNYVSGLHPPHMKQEVELPSILWDKRIQKYKHPGKRLFQTDQFGTIIPSTLEGSLGSQHSVLFCGGSTTETMTLNENNRVPDLYSALTKVKSVNASKSGKDLNGCLKTVECLLSIGYSPGKIVFANNVNTLGALSLGLPPGRIAPISPKNYKYRLFPGLSTLYYVAKNSFIRRLKQSNSLYSSQIGYLEQSLLDGCCHSPAKAEGTIIDWESSETQQEYTHYVSKIVSQLDKLVKKYGLNKSSIYIFIEPNSFKLGGHVSLSSKDTRQVLERKNGSKYSLEESGKITDTYDRIYKILFEKTGYNVISVPGETMVHSDFYDAVHLTPSGALKVATTYARSL